MSTGDIVDLRKRDGEDRGAVDDNRVGNDVQCEGDKSQQGDGREHLDEEGKWSEAKVLSDEV